MSSNLPTDTIRPCINGRGCDFYESIQQKVEETTFLPVACHELARVILRNEDIGNTLDCPFVRIASLVTEVEVQNA